jgi:imidazolonepropionase-like amidohydrolase
VILIDGERITAVGTVDTLEVPPGAEVIRTDGMTVLPGLIDLDVHLAFLGHGDRRHWASAYLPLAERVVMPAAAAALLRAGVTTARDVGSPLEAAIAVRDRIRAKHMPGPALYVSGPVLGPDGAAAASAGRAYVEVDGAADARQKAERLLRAGVDVLVVADAASLGSAELAAIAAAARDAGIAWYAAVRRDADIGVALEAGARGLLGIGAGLDPELAAPAAGALRVRALAGRPVAWSVGSSVLTNHAWLREAPGPLDDPAWREGLPPIIGDDIRASLANLDAPGMLETPTLRRAVLASRLRSARAAGAELRVGSDAGEPAQLPARATWQEIEALVLEAGLTPAEAIRAATLDAAAVLGIEHETGSLTPGKYADILVVRGDPLRHIERLQDVEIVIRPSREAVGHISVFALT